MFVDQKVLSNGWVRNLRVVEESIQTERERLIAQLTPSSKIDEVEWRLAIQSELHWLSETESDVGTRWSQRVVPLVNGLRKVAY